MAAAGSAVHGQSPSSGRPPVVNDFSIQVATANGSGSQTANLVLLRTLLLMGVPASGKNMFPSNISGLPTWYTIRASRRGYIGRKKEVDFLVAMNPETAREDVLALEPGMAVVYDEPLKLNELRNDVVFYPVPFDKLVAPVCPDAKLRRLVRNMIYDGILAKLLNIDMGLMEKALNKQLGKKAKAVALDAGALSFYEFIHRPRPDCDVALSVRANEVQTGDDVLLIYTSGSTGRPKGVIHSQDNIVRNIAVQTQHFGFNHTARVLLHFPINHVAADVEIGFGAIYAGSALILMDQFDALASLEIIERERNDPWALEKSISRTR